MVQRLVLSAVALVLLLPIAGLGQHSTAIPRRPDNRPDLQGTWDLRTAKLVNMLRAARYQERNP